MSPPPKRQRLSLTHDYKIMVCDKLRAGETVSSLARLLNKNESTIRTIRSQEKLLRDSVASGLSKSKTYVSYTRNELLEKTEGSLILWIQDMHERNVPLNSCLIRAKAKKIFDHLNGASSFEFHASKGWFDRCKKRLGLHLLKLCGESASADNIAAQNFPEELAKIIQEGGYCPDQVFNTDETGLFWKKMPNRTFVSKTERSAPGFKAAKDRVSLLLYSNASGDFKGKSMLIYRSENPRTLPKIKDQLPVFWRSNKKAWVTGLLFADWFHNCFVKQVKAYLLSKNLAFKAILLIDNAPGHPLTLMNAHPDIKVIFLPPNTTSLLQPLDQGVIAAFKAYYTRRCFAQILNNIDDNSEETVISAWKKFTIADCIAVIDLSWKEVKDSTINACWAKLWPEVVKKESRLSPITEDYEEIVRISHEIGHEGFSDLQIEEIQDLIESHEAELTEEELQEIVEEQQVDSEQMEEEPSETTRTLTLSDLRKLLDLQQRLVDEVTQLDPSATRSFKVKLDIEAAMLPYQELYQEKLSSTKQSRITKYFQRST